MARHGRARRRRRTFNLRRVRTTSSSAIGALASLDVLVGPIINTASNAYRVMSLNLTWGISDLGATADDGQEFGVAHSDYSAAEVEECLEAAASIDIGDKVAIEQANRLVRVIGQMTGAPGTGAGLSYNEGLPVKTKLNWAIGIGDTLNVWVRNGSGTVYTTGATITATGDIWVKDNL